MSRRDREEAVAILSKRINNAQGLFVVDYTGLNVDKITGLRRQMKEAGSELKVAKNTLLRIATKDTRCEPLKDTFTGQTAVAFIEGDPARAAKVLTKFVKENEKESPEFAFKIRAGVLEEAVLSDAEIDALGNLPPREVMLGQLVGMLAAPMTGFVSVLSDVPRKFLRALAAIAAQKEAQEK